MIEARDFDFADARQEKLTMDWLQFPYAFISEACIPRFKLRFLGTGMMLLKLN